MITPTLQKLIKKVPQRTYKYILAGVIIYLVELLVIVLAQKLGSSSVMAVGISFWVGLVISFIVQKFFTFKDHRTNHRVVLKQIFLVSLLICFNFLFTITIAKLLQAYVPAVVSRTVALAITTSWNYLLYTRRIFNH